MGKYSASMEDVYEILSGFTSGLDIMVYPESFISKDPGSEFMRVSIIPSSPGLNLRSASGQVIVDIFIAAGNGPKKAYLIADKLDVAMVGKSVERVGFVTQFGKSSLSSGGPDRDDPTLQRFTYEIPFNHYGVDS